MGATLLGAVGIGLAVPFATARAASDVTGKGKITFEQDNSTLPSNVPGGSSGGSTMTHPTQNPDPLALKIVSVTDVDFDTHKIVTNNNEKTYDALPFTDPGTKQTIAHFVRYQDIRSDVATNFYTIQAELTKQFSTKVGETEFTLDGATLDYKNVALVTGTNGDTLPSATAVKQNPFQLTQDNGAQDVVVNKEDGKGFGVFEIMFDTNENAAKSLEKPAEGEQATKYDGITLTIPGKNVLKAKEYSAEITWTISDSNNG